MIPREKLIEAAFWCVAFALLCCVLFFSSGCNLPRRVASPAATVTTPTGTVLTQSGDAAQPASVSTKTTTQQATLPAGSVVWQDAQTGTLEYRLAKDTPIATTVRTEEAKAPQAFTPPAPPTPKDEADGKARLMFWIALPLGVAAAGFGLVRDYTMLMIGGGVVAAGAACGLFVQAHPLVFVALAIGVLLCVLGPVLYHTIVKNLPTKIP